MPLVIMHDKLIHEYYDADECDLILCEKKKKKYNNNNQIVCHSFSFSPSLTAIEHQLSLNMIDAFDFNTSLKKI